MASRSFVGLGNDYCPWAKMTLVVADSALWRIVDTLLECKGRSGRNAEVLAEYPSKLT